MGAIRSENMSYPACTLGREGGGGRQCQKKLEENATDGSWCAADSALIEFAVLLSCPACMLGREGVASASARRSWRRTPLTAPGESWL